MVRELLWRTRDHARKVPDVSGSCATVQAQSAGPSITDLIGGYCGLLALVAELAAADMICVRRAMLVQTRRETTIEVDDE